MCLEVLTCREFAFKNCFTERAADWQLHFVFMMFVLVLCRRGD